MKLLFLHLDLLVLELMSKFLIALQLGLFLREVFTLWLLALAASPALFF
jgi:hypothetical protein